MAEDEDERKGEDCPLHDVPTPRGSSYECGDFKACVDCRHNPDNKKDQESEEEDDLKEGDAFNLNNKHFQGHDPEEEETVYIVKYKKNGTIFGVYDSGEKAGKVIEDQDNPDAYKQIPWVVE